MTIQILVVEPATEVRDALRACFSKNQIEMSVLYNLPSLLPRLDKELPSAIVMRAEQPIDGLKAALRQLRDAGHEMPVIVVSRSADVVDKIVALELGADDYLVDPFDPHELVARIRCVLRRCTANPYRLPDEGNRYQFGEIEVDFCARRVYMAGRTLSFRESEFLLLKVFASHPMRVLSRMNLLSLLGKNSLQQSERGLDVLVFRLRTLIEHTTGHRYIQTVRGRGYIFVPTLLDERVSGRTTAAWA
ncbi:winged helix-turn-helix domain-containing protein [Burkholderia anthina]|uniref:winged helix-turn-helix domain-containing protein n=1 Tax=Burkholderia anthina TaxID=179879 RepID=UPI0037C045AB